MFNGTTVKPGGASSESAAPTVVPESSDFEKTCLTIVGYLAAIGYESRKLPAPSSVGQWHAIANLYDTL